MRFQKVEFVEICKSLSINFFTNTFLITIILFLFMIFHFIFTNTSLAFELDLSTIFEKTIKEKITGVISPRTNKRERSQEERQLSFIARDIIERGKIPNQLKEKYRYNQIYPKQGKGRIVSYNILELPPFSKVHVRLQAYCMDSFLPAPTSGEKMYLIPITNLLIKEFIPIYEALMQYSALHPEKHYQIQRIVWFMRHLSEERYIPSYSLVSEDIRLIENIYPGGSNIIENQKRKVLIKRKISEVIDVLLDKTIPPEIKNVLRELSKLGYDINTPPGDLRTANNIVIETLRIINTMKPQGDMGENSEYTFLPNDLAVKSEHGGGASVTTLVVVNPTPEIKILDFRQYVLQSDRNTQRLGLGGVVSTEWKEMRWEVEIIASFQWRWPVDCPKIVLDYGHQNPMDNKKFHAGINVEDLRVSCTPGFIGSCSAVFAAADGKVAKVFSCKYEDCHYDGDPNSNNHDMQNVVILEHHLPDGRILYSLYAHLGKLQKKFKKGEHIKAGDLLGYTGIYSQNGMWLSYVHFEIKDKPVLENPKSKGSHWGYVPWNPDDYGYHDPKKFLPPIIHDGCDHNSRQSPFIESTSIQHKIDCPISLKSLSRSNFPFHAFNIYNSVTFKVDCWNVGSVPYKDRESNIAP